MKRMSFLLVMVALSVAMSVAFGADKKNNVAPADSSLKVVIDFKAACRPGDSVLVVVKATGGKKPLVIRCGDRQVGESFYIKPDSSQQNFLVTVTESGGDAQAYSLPIKTFERVRKNFFIGNFVVKSTDIKTVPAWRDSVKKVVDFYNYWTKMGVTFDIRGVSWADTISASEKLNKQLSAGRFIAVTDATKIPVTRGEELIGSETKRGFDYELVETDASLARRMDGYRSAAINVKPVSMVPIVKETIKTITIIRSIFDRISVGVGHQASPYGYNGVVGTGAIALAGNPDTTGFSLSLTGTIGRTSLNGLSYLETHQAGLEIQYNLFPWLGFSIGGGYYQWADVYNRPASPLQYNRYTKQGVSWKGELGFFVGPVKVAPFITQGSLDKWSRDGEDSFTIQNFQRIAKQNGVTITANPIKMYELFF